MNAPALWHPSIVAETRRRYRGPADAVRIGLPPRPLSDLYYRLMQGSWWRLAALFVVFYLLANIGFAALYMLDLQGISATHEGSFADAFFFSVQTISTIGYGTMTPKTGLANLLVTAESMVGLAGFGVATGLIFARFSRPTARVMFSDKLVMTKRHGKPVLMLRVANARGNEVVEASIRVTVLQTDVSPEGHKMRRVIDLPVLRSTSPIFALSWLVIHEIDDASPLFGATAEDLAGDLSLFIVTLMGVDATFADTVHARHIYTDEDIAWNQRFVDVIEDLPDGGLQIDYTKFHDTVPDGLATEPTDPA